MAFNITEEKLPETIEVNLTPMIDIMTCLLFFLLLGYKSQSVMLESAQNLLLPPSDSEKGLVITLTVSASLEEIKLQDSHVMFLKAGKVPEKELSGNKIVPLYNRLVRMVQIMRKRDSDESIVLLLADKRMKTDTITQIMKTCGMAGLPNFHFGVAKP